MNHNTSKSPIELRHDGQVRCKPHPGSEPSQIHQRCEGRRGDEQRRKGSSTRGGSADVDRLSQSPQIGTPESQRRRNAAQPKAKQVDYLMTCSPSLPKPSTSTSIAIISTDSSDPPMSCDVPSSQIHQSLMFFARTLTLTIQPCTV